MEADIKPIYIAVWKFRDTMEEFWPTPPQGDSFRFAYCEMGETINEMLLLNPKYRRNNPTPPDEEKIFEELADVAMMLITCLGPEQQIYRQSGISVIPLDGIADTVNEAWKFWRARRRNQELWKQRTIAAISAIAVYPGMDLAARVNERLERIKIKHGPKETLDAEPDLVLESLVAGESAGVLTRPIT